MTKISAVLIALFIASSSFAGPVLQMNRAFNALTDLIPYLTEREKFMEKKNESLIAGKIAEIQGAFKSARHDTAIREDLFAPSYAVINDNLSGSLDAFKKGKKDYAHWRLKEITTLCLDCHTRLPTSHTSSFQNDELRIDQSKFENIYNLGIAQLIVRRYEDARASFTRAIDDKLIKKEIKDLDLPFKQLLLIDTKVLRNPENLIVSLEQYNKRKGLPDPLQEDISGWLKRLKYWKGNKVLSEGLKTDQDVAKFVEKELAPLKKKAVYSGGYDVDLLITSGLLSNYLFVHPHTQMAPEISFWLGWAEKYLKRENFFGSGDLFLKQCIKKYPSHPTAKMCLDEYKESVEFEFSGSAGTNIPEDVQSELKNLEKLIKSK